MNVADKIPASRITIDVPAPIYTKLAGMAAAQKIKPIEYARNLMLAAFAARQGPTGDNALDAAVESLCSGVVPKSQAAGALAAQLAEAKEELAKLRDDREREGKEFDAIVIERDDLLKRVKDLSTAPIEAPAGDWAAAMAQNDELRTKISELGTQLITAGEHERQATAAQREIAKLLKENSDAAADLKTAKTLLAEFQASQIDMSQTALEAENTIANLFGQIKELEARPNVDRIVTALVIGLGANFTVQFLAKNSGLSEDYVARVLTIWDEELKAAKRGA